MTRFEVVTHCWGGTYWRALAYHLDSLFRHPPLDATVKVAVCYTESDRDTSTLMHWWMQQRSDEQTDNGNVWLCPMALSEAEVCARGIGRNRAALSTGADLVWYADCDYAIGPGFWDSLAAGVGKKPGPLFYPRQALGLSKELSRTLLDGVRLSKLDHLHPLPTEKCQPHKYRKAIGGIQFVWGDYCRKHGYCRDNRREQTPSTRGWKPETADIRFRKQVGVPGVPIDVVGLYRIRHEGRLTA